MRVQFVYSIGKSEIGRPTILSQADALEKNGVTVSLEPLPGSGFFGYCRKLLELKHKIKTVNPDIVHAHYSYNGFITSLATRKPVVTSLMGMDVNDSAFWRWVIRIFVKHVWSKTIVKSKEMERKLRLSSNLIHVIPNGVNIDVYRPMNQAECRKEIGWDQGDRIILFGGNPHNMIKNFALAKQSFGLISKNGFQLKCLEDIDPNDVPLYLNASDVLLLTSHSEGSPNIVKEAMACNLPVVSTDVGDVSWLLDGVTNSYITDFDPSDIAKKLLIVLKHKAGSNGRDRLVDLGLESGMFSLRVKQLYEEITAHASI